MTLYKISQRPERVDYDTYSSAVVCAKDQDDARTIHPNEEHYVYKDGEFHYRSSDGRTYPEIYDTSWDRAELISVQYLGEAAPGIERGVLCASFHAG